MRLGTNGRHLTVTHEKGRWPTLRGENPPRGVPYRSLTIWLWPSSLTLHMRWYRWRKDETAEDKRG